MLIEYRMPRTSSTPIKIHSNTHVPAIYSQKPSFLQTIKEGVAFGVGSSIGHRIVGAITGSSHIQVDTKQKEYEQCMKEFDDKAVCQRILEK